MGRSPVSSVRLPKSTPPPQPAADPHTPPPLPKVTPQETPAARPTTPAGGTAKPSAPEPFKFEYKAPSGGTQGTDFDRTALHLRNTCLVSLWQCAQVTCQYESVTSRTLLTPITAATLDAPLVLNFKNPATLAEERYKVARATCDNSLTPPAPRPSLEELRRNAPFYLDLENWFQGTEPIPVIVTQSAADKTSTNWGLVASGVATAALAGALAAWYAGNDLIPVVGQTAGLNDDAFIAPAWAQMVSGLQTAWSAF